MKALVVAGLLVLPPAALAQTYNCEPGALRGVDCRLVPSDQAAASRAVEDARLADFMADLGRSPAATPRSEPAPTAGGLDQLTLTKMQAGALIAEGKCIEASGLAAEKGDIALVRAVRAVCH